MSDASVPSAVAAEISNMSFEKALAKLDATVRKLESGEVELDAAVEAFEEGVQLKRHCEAKLAEARERVEQITQLPNGDVKVSPLPPME